MKGDVYAHLDVDDPEKYETLESVYVEINNELVPYFIQEIRVRDKGTLLAFEACNDLESAEAIKSCKLFLPLSDLPTLVGDEFYYHDVIGYKVVDAALGPLGLITAFYDREGQDILVMAYQGAEVLIPVSGDIIGRADHEKEEVRVTLPEGLIDIYL